MDISKFLSKVLGIYLIIISIVMLMDMQRMLDVISGFVNNPSLIFVTGAFTLILGILLIASHNIWKLDWRLIITFIAWTIFIKGLCVIVAPQFIDKFALMIIENSRIYYSAAILDLCLGVILSYIGFIK